MVLLQFGKTQGEWAAFILGFLVSCYIMSRSLALPILFEAYHSYEQTFGAYHAYEKVCDT